MSTITADMKLRYIIDADKPYLGYTHSILLPDDTVAYTEGLKLDQYALERGFTPKVISGSELDELIKIHMESLRVSPKVIDKTRYWEMLEVLPPCRWTMAGMWEVFHVSERLTGHLVSWFASGRLNGQEFYFEMVDYDNMTIEDLRITFNEAHLELSNEANNNE